MRWVAVRYHLIVFGASLCAAAFIRFWAAPLAAGPDVAQFWAFAKVFHSHGLDFYRYADASGDIFPFGGWRFVYPPIWLLILGLSLLFAPGSTATATMVDTSWRIAMKTPIIMADLSIGILLYWAVTGPKWKKLLFSVLWLFHPTAWYESAVFGQFDAVAAALLLAAVIMLEKGKDWLAFAIAGLAVMTKQHVVIPVAMMVVISARYMTRSRILRNCAFALGVGVVLSAPFLITGNFSSFTHAVLRPGWNPDYQSPLVYAFSGSSSLLTYLHNVFGWDTSRFLQFSLPVLGLALLIVAVLTFRMRRTITLAQGALVGYLLFISLSYQVNYQYVVVYIPLALLVASRTHYRSERVAAIIIAMLPMVWLWLFDVSFWFRDLAPRTARVTPIFDRIGMSRYPPDYVYVAFALLLMASSFAYVVCTFLHWRQPESHEPGKG